MASRARPPFYVLITLFAFFQITSYIWPKHHTSSPARLATHLFKRGEPANGLELQCQDVWDQKDQCAHVKEYCAGYLAGGINYLHIYFCSLSAWHGLSLILMGVWIVFLFAFVGVAASEFFCPNLNTIAKKLRLSESMTGITFLAFGNASPDIFSTFSAITAGNGTMAIGEVIGGASFTTSVVVGSMAIIMPFQVGREPFLRDITLLGGCALFMLFVVVTKKITFMRSMLLVAAYITYMALVVFYSWGPQQSQGLDEYTPQGEDADHTNSPAGYDEEAVVPQVSTAGVPQISIAGVPQISIERSSCETTTCETTLMTPLSGSGSTIPSIDRSRKLYSSTRKCPKIFINTARSPSYLNVSPKEWAGYSPIDGEDRNRFKESLLDDDQCYTQFQQALLHHSLLVPDRNDPLRSPILLDSPKGFFQDDILPVSFRERCALVFKDWIRPVYFPSLLGWDEKSWILKALAIGSIPSILILTLTLPVVDIPEDEHDESEVAVQHIQDEEPMSVDTTSTLVSQNNGWCQIRTVVQMVFAPVFITTVVVHAADQTPLAIVGALGVGIAMATLVFHFSTEAKPPRFHEGLAFLGFIVAMTWIYIVANEVVCILQALGTILGISDAILGLTVFAMGNSLGDLVANITIARMGFPRMAFSACFGGPLLSTYIDRVGYGNPSRRLQTNRRFFIQICCLV
ncbi:Sodium/calcium exchanger protein-domain-containing protein [Mortierella sp. GBAus27b]|nr:Sodium/calcium exchanger protein-domain-containing protein [Mortierella sp. GBAus27b]